MSDPILTETGSHVTATLNPQSGVVVEVMGTGRVSRVILDPQAARDLAEQLDFAASGRIWPEGKEPKRRSPNVVSAKKEGGQD